MLHDPLPLLPDRLTGAPPDVLGGVALAGLVFWLFGARYSRSQVTLAAVAGGAWLGMLVPHALHWAIEPMSIGVVGAMALGTVAYLFHRTVVAVLLGALLAAWAAAGAWIERGAGATWSPAGLHWSGDTVGFLRQLWQSLPGDLGRVIPAVGACALAAGVLTGVLWPRLGRCLLYSAGGITAAVAAGLPLLARMRPEALQHLPPSAEAQAAILVACVAVGLAAQWRLTRESAKAGPAAAPAAKPAAVRATARNPSASVRRPAVQPRGLGAPSRPLPQPAGAVAGRA